MLKYRSYEETPVDTLNISPKGFRADYIYTIPKVAWDAAKTAGTLSSTQSTIEGNVNGFVAQAADAYVGMFYHDATDGTSLGWHGKVALAKMSSGSATLLVGAALATIAAALSF